MLPFSTPIDRALPLLALLVVAIAVVCGVRRRVGGATQILFAIPLLAACAICFPEERVRLLAYGIVFAAAYCGALFAIDEWTFANCAALLLIGIAALRWIARERIEIGREVLITLGALLIVAVMRKSPLAIAIALAAAFVSPGIPMRTALIPFAVAALAWLIRVRMVVIPALAIAVMLILFPWSGVAARALPYFFRATPHQRVQPLGFALKPGEAIGVDVPENARSLALSAANGYRWKRSTVAGSIDGRPVTMRDLADWGYMRREQWWRSRNHLPCIPAGIVRGYGYDAWVDGAGSVPLPPHAKRITIVADPHLPANARLQVEAFEQ